MMKYSPVLFLLVGFYTAIGMAQNADVAHLIKTSGTLVLHDDFNREEPNDSIEHIGEGWKTNSHRITKDGRKQVDLTDNTLVMDKSEDAIHGGYVYRTAEFKNGIIQARFKIFKKQGIGFNITDPDYKGSHFGHICQVSIKPEAVKFRDGKTGIFNNKIVALRKKGMSRKDISERIETTLHSIDKETTVGEWHTTSIWYDNDVIKVYIDETFVGEYKSPGFAHESKKDFGFAIWGKVQVDDIKIWRLQS